MGQIVAPHRLKPDGHPAPLRRIPRMSSFVRLLAGFLVLLAAATGHTQAAPPAAAAASAPGRAAAALERTVIEDDNVRIEETRLRGAAQRITVQSKISGVAPYEIIVGPAGRDASQQRGAAGQRAWSILSF